MMDGWQVQSKASQRDSPATMLFRTILLLITNGIALVGYMMAFSAMGYGVEVFDTLSDYKAVAFYCLSMCFLIFLTMYMLDYSYWPSSMKAVKYTCVGIILLGLGVGNVLSASKYPQAPVGLFFLVLPGYVYFIKRFLFRTVTVANFLENMCHSLVICCIAVMVLWINWFSSGDKFWDYNTKVAYTLQIESCEKPVFVSSYLDADNTTEITDAALVAARNMQILLTPLDAALGVPADHKKILATHKWCMAGFLVWISPMIVAVGCFMFGMVCHFVSQSMFQRGGKGIGVRVFGGFMALCILCMWVAASVAGGGMQIANLVSSLIVVAIVLIGVVLCSTIGFSSLKSKVMDIPVVKSIAGSFLSDWVKALFVLCGGPIFFFYLGLSVKSHTKTHTRESPI